jgi:osmotically-inducible protein OsmY
MTRNTCVLLAAVALVLAGCNKGDKSLPGDDNRLGMGDRTKTVSPLDQGNSRADVDTAAAIRKSLVSDDNLSMEAKNIKIVANNGVITLRGPVKSEAEHTRVVAAARSNAGSYRVDDQIEVEGAEGNKR